MGRGAKRDYWVRQEGAAIGGSARFPRQDRDRLFAAQRTLAEDDNQTSGILLSIGVPDVFPRPLRGRSAAILSQDSLIFLHSQIALLQQVVHFSSREVGFLQRL